MENKTLTNYSKGWADYKKTNSYKEISKFLSELGIRQPYRDNIIMEVFEAGWNATNTKIKLINNGK